MNLRFESRFVDSLPGDPIVSNYCRQVANACYSIAIPTPVSDPKIICYAREVAELLGIDPTWLETREAALLFGGSKMQPEMKPYAACYGGHQFGHWAGQLGDGRAINLGELRASDSNLWTVQLKGSGRTPYSRSGDGLAVLRSSLREFICSEAMHHLGVPTTRALCLTITGEEVTRDMFYDGHPKQEPGAIVCRVAPSFIRFGNFEILNARKEFDNLRALANYSIAHDFPHLDLAAPNVHEQWFGEICERTADLLVQWMRVGFVHGVMNTDNMSILGQTIDYGPYGWLEGFEPNWTPNTTDAAGRRYAFSNQPQIAHWNLLQLANSLWPLFEKEEPLQQGLDRYVVRFQTEYFNMMANKLGLRSFQPESDHRLVEELERILQLTETDFTLFYRALANVPAHLQNDESRQDDNLGMAETKSLLLSSYYTPDQVDSTVLEPTSQWLNDYRRRVHAEGRPDAERREAMNAVNPLYVPRNYLVQQSIDAAESGNYDAANDLLQVFRSPYTETPGRDAYAEKRPEWARQRAGCSMLSCSS